MGDAQSLRKHDTDLSSALVVGLEAGEHEIGGFILERGRKGARSRSRVGGSEVVAEDVDGAIGASRERLAQDLHHTHRSGRDRDDLAAVLLAKTKRRLKRIGVWLVQLPCGMCLVEPQARPVDSDRRLAGYDLFQADGDAHYS
jgi:hypothetical protein